LKFGIFARIKLLD